jgi:hypothetical protein
MLRAACLCTPWTQALRSTELPTTTLDRTDDFFVLSEELMRFSDVLVATPATPAMHVYPINTCDEAIINTARAPKRVCLQNRRCVLLVTHPMLVTPHALAHFQ